MIDGKRTLSYCVFFFVLVAPRLALADPVGLVVVDATTAEAQALGLSVCNVYVEFDDPNDRLLLVGSSDIWTNDPLGFYQHPLGSPGDTAPSQFFIDLDPDVKFDSFITIGLDVVPFPGADGTTRDPDWNTFEFNNNGHALGGWYNGSPSNGAGDVDANFQVLVGQFTITAGSYVYGDFEAYYNDGWNFFWGCFQHNSCVTCDAADLNCDQSVDGTDLNILLAAYGANPCHPADLNGDDTVDNADVIILRSAYQSCPGLGF